MWLQSIGCGYERKLRRVRYHVREHTKVRAYIGDNTEHVNKRSASEEQVREKLEKEHVRGITRSREREPRPKFEMNQLSCHVGSHITCVLSYLHDLIKKG
jgi:hypothetical protein